MKKRKMREHKYRAWDRLKNRMIYADEYWIGKTGWSAINRTNGVAFVEADHLNGELLEYTGVKDRHGNDIYEGDILKIGDIIGVIEWTGVEFYFECKEQNHWWNDDWNYRQNDIEIVGNIYKNPELL